MWCDHPFSQRNKTTKRAVKVEVGDEGREWTKFEKRGGGCGAENIGLGSL